MTEKIGKMLLMMKWRLIAPLSLAPPTHPTPEQNLFKYRVKKVTRLII